MSVPTHMALRLAAACALLATAGCYGGFAETHLMATVDKAGNTANIFRIRVRGDTSLTNVRYLAGYYDERAVEAFFNETKSETLADADLNKSGVPPIFKPVPCKDPSSDDCTKAKAEAYRLIPLGSESTAEGTFVMILSTNPDAIVSTIGSFVDNDQVVQSTMFLATRGDREASAALSATKSTIDDTRHGVVTELNVLLPAASATDTTAVRYVAALQAIASGIAPESSPTFKTIAQARSWFAALPRGAAQ